MAQLPSILVEAAQVPTSTVKASLSAKDTTLEQGKGNGVKLTVELRDQGQKVRGGMVSIFDNGKLIAKVAPKGGSGKADYVLPNTTSLGVHVITAVYTDAAGIDSVPSNEVTIEVIAGKKAEKPQKPQQAPKAQKAGK